jgi:hypothetical protein
VEAAADTVDREAEVVAVDAKEAVVAAAVMKMAEATVEEAVVAEEVSFQRRDDVAFIQSTDFFDGNILLND